MTLGPEPRRCPIAAALFIGLAACGGDAQRADRGAAPSEPELRPELRPETARWPQVEAFQSDLAATRHPGDGGGAARLVMEPDRIFAGGDVRLLIELEIGEHGIAPGGAITFMPEPFWGWSTPQHDRDDLPGYTDVTVAGAAGATLQAETFGGAEAGMLILRVEGDALAAGDVVTLDYGAGTRGARADRYAGRDARLWIGVDADGDGVRALVDSSPSVDVLPRGPERLVLLGPSVIRPGEDARFSVSVLDGWANSAPRTADGSIVRGEVRIDGLPADWKGPELVALGDGGSASFTVMAGEALPASVRLRAAFNVDVEVDEDADSGRVTLRATANPAWVTGDAPRILWADLHGHTGLSDGTGSVEDYVTYGRDVARLDVIALTDHDHFGPVFLDASPDRWAEIQAVQTAFHRDASFVTVPGFEWTSWIHGHRHVLRFDEGGKLLSSLDERYDNPAKLWDALRGTPSITVAHHSSGHPVPVNWTFGADPELEPVTEVISVHGTSESRDVPGGGPRAVSGSRAGLFVRDQLERGLRLGFIGSGDSHDGHPGLAHLSPSYGWRPGGAAGRELSGTGGIAAIYSSELTRASVLAALRSRATYATSGPRIAVAAEVTDGSIDLRVAGTAPIAVMDRVSSEGEPRVRRIGLPASNALDARVTVPGPSGAEDYCYIRIVQTDGAAAWVGPFFTE